MALGIQVVPPVGQHEVRLLPEAGQHDRDGVVEPLEEGAEAPLGIVAHEGGHAFAPRRLACRGSRSRPGRERRPGRVVDRLLHGNHHGDQGNPQLPQSIRDPLDQPLGHLPALGDHRNLLALRRVGEPEGMEGRSQIPPDPPPLLLLHDLALARRRHLLPTARHELQAQDP